MTAPNEKIQESLEPTAEEILRTFDAVATAAKRTLEHDSSPSANALASVKTFTDTKAVRSLDRIREDKLENSRRLQREPAIARVIVKVDDGSPLTFYVCRTSTPSPSSLGLKVELASYRSPVGRLASLQIGASAQRIETDVFDELGKYTLISKTKVSV